MAAAPMKSRCDCKALTPSCQASSPWYVCTSLTSTSCTNYGLVTSGPRGQLEVHDPAAAARQAGDEKAAQAWEQGFAAKEGTGRTERYVLLNAAAVEKMQAASTNLAQNQDSMHGPLPKRPKSGGSDDCIAKPEVKRVRREPS